MKASTASSPTVPCTNGKPRAIRPGFISSLNAAYTVGEITELLRNSDLKGAMVTTDFYGLCISGEKK
ncbi:hypothetical protein [Hungatella sp.]|uniref:hypothetical protein n=1 Tax=Hungatella sp. TaxID=2613924 RepID=UPI000A9FBD54